MASKSQQPKAVSATLPTGTKVTASQEVIDKIKGASTSSSKK